MIEKLILLVNPPQENTLPLGIEDELMDMVGYYPPLGLLYLATVLKREGYKVQVLDCEPMKIGYSGLRDKIRQLDPFLIGISGESSDMRS